MPYEIVRSPQAHQDIRQFARYLKREAGPRIARAYFQALECDVDIVIANNPDICLWFHEIGEPYRAILFRSYHELGWRDARQKKDPTADKRR